MIHVVLVTVFPKEPQSIDHGIAAAAKYLADELCRHPDVKLTVIVPGGDERETTCEGWGAFNVYRLGREGFWSFLPGTLYDMLAGKRQLSSLLRELKPDIVHFQDFTFLAANCDQPNVLTIHGNAEKDVIWGARRGLWRQPKLLLLRLIQWYRRRRVRNVVLTGDYAKKCLSPSSDARKTWLIEDPVADSFFDIDRNCEPGRILCRCMVRPKSNVLGMIRAFTLIGEKLSYARLRIAGAAETAYLEECERQAETDGIQDRVCFLGNISIEDVQLELSRANCLVVPSFQEDAPLNIAAAMAAGVPVVASNVGGIPGMVRDGKTGLLANPHDARGMAGAVLQIISDKKLAESMTQRAKKIAAERFRASIICEKTLEAYREVLAESQCP